MKRLLTMIAMIGTLTASAQTPVYQDVNKPIEERVQDALARMTLEEKCRITYAQSKFTSPGVPRLGIPELYMSDGPHGVRMEINWNDWAHANWTNDYVTAFPALTCLAATWNPDLVMLYGKSVGEEALYRKKNVLLGPGVNIYRTPLNGRNFEYMGEDPYLAGEMAVPYIQGLQSNGVACCVKHYNLNEQEEFRGHVDTKVSDRALHEIYMPAFKAAVERGGAWSIMGAYNRYRGIHNTHNKYLINELLKRDMAFDGAVVSDWGAAHDSEQSIYYGLDIEMGSYTNGLTSEANGFGYDDYNLGKDYLLKAQLLTTDFKNPIMPFDKEAAKNMMDVVNEKAARVLRLIFRCAMNGKNIYGSINSPEHLAANRAIAEEGIVLLKNNPSPALPHVGGSRKVTSANDKPLLPIDIANLKSPSPVGEGRGGVVILVVGDNATKSLCVGGGSSELKPKDEVSALRGIQERFGKDCTIEYAQGYESGRSRYDGADVIPQALQDSLHDDAIEKAKRADLIIYIGGLNKNHFEDCEGGDRRFYEMSYGQDKLIADLLAVQPRMITVIVSGNAVAMPWLDKVPALIQSWYLGSETGHALAAVLSGDVNPSGKTVFTYAKTLEDYPAHQYGLIGYPGVEPQDMPEAFLTEKDLTLKGLEKADAKNGVPSSAYLIANSAKLKKAVPEKLSNAHRNTDFNAWKHNGKGNEVQVYAEDIFVGYRYFDQQPKRVVFPFGYGLSYTTFAYSQPSLSSKTITADGTITASIKVKNTGKVAGKEVVQLYIGDDKASVVRPVKELKGFKKIALEPGEEKTVTFTIKADDLKFYDETTQQWKAEPGTFKAYIGASSQDIKAALPFKL